MSEMLFIAFPPGGGSYAAEDLRHIMDTANACGADKVRLREVPDEPDALDVEYLRAAGGRNSIPFERIRRITGYLVGTLDRFNDAKRAEERDRVKHGL